LSFVFNYVKRNWKGGIGEMRMVRRLKEAEGGRRRPKEAKGGRGRPTQEVSKAVNAKILLEG
jgi:hypothetical protein